MSIRVIRGQLVWNIRVRDALGLRASLGTVNGDTEKTAARGIVVRAPVILFLNMLFACVHGLTSHLETLIFANIQNLRTVMR